MNKTIRKATILFLLLIVSSSCAFADPNPAPSVNFQIAHAINVSVDYYFEFQNPATYAAYPNSSVSFSSPGEYRFALLAFVLRAGTVTFSSVEIQVSDLINTEDSEKYCDFIFRVYEANNTAVSIPFIADPDKHGAGYSVLKTIWSPLSGSDEIAELWITIDDTNAVAGTYQGTVRVVITD